MNGQSYPIDMSVKFSKVDRYVTTTHLSRIRLFFQLLGLGGGAVENETHLYNFYSILQTASSVNKQKALDLIQYILTFVGVGGSKITDLDQASFEYCKKTLAYPSAIVGVCMHTSNDEFKKLQMFGSESLKCAPGNIPSMEYLCFRLHHLDLISSNDIGLLAEWLGLDGVGRADLASRLVEYARSGVYEDPVINHALGDGRFPNLPIQATDDGEDSSGNEVIVTIRIHNNGEATLDRDVERDATRAHGNSSQQGDQHLAPAASTMERVTSFSDVKGVEEPSPSLYPPLPDQGQRSLSKQVSTTSSNVSDEPGESQMKSLIVQTKTNTNGKTTKKKLMLPKRISDKRKKRLHRICFLLAIICLVAGLILVAGPVYFGVYGVPYLSFDRTVYATGGQTVVVTEFSDLLSLTVNSMHECPQSDDYSHVTSLFVIPMSELEREHRFVRMHKSYNLTDPDCTLNFLDDHFYLLKGSEINLEVCLTTDTVSEGTGTLLIFDNNAAYGSYVRNDNCQSRDGAHTHNLNIGSFGRFVCTNITYTSRVNGYHYIVTDIPADIWVSYSYSCLQFYLNPEDFIEEPFCTFSSEGDNYCPLQSVSQTPVYLIAFVQKNIVDNSFFTHLCFSSSWAPSLIALVVVSGLLSVCGITLFVLCCACCVYRCCK